MRELDQKISHYKEMIQDPRVDQRQLMLKFDKIIEFAKENSLNVYPMSTCHALMDSGERKRHKIFNIAFKMRSNARLTLNTFLPCKTLSYIDNVSIVLTGTSSAIGLIETTRLMPCRQLYDIVI